MDGYEDLPILLSVIQSNKVNIYCIYIKNYPGIEWRRVAFIGVFPGVTSPWMGAHGEKRKCKSARPNLFTLLRPPLHPPGGGPPPAFATPPCRPPAPPARPQPGTCGRARLPACPGRRSVGSRAAVKTEAGSPEHSQRHWPEEIWGVIEEGDTGGGTAPLCLLLGYIIF